MSSDPLILGIDEAGRGPALGPLFVAGIALPESILPQLESMGIRDSKQVSPGKREQFYTLLQQLNSAIYWRKLTAKEIDRVLRDPSDNLNLLEIRKMAEIINEVKPATAYVDAISTPAYFKHHLNPLLKSPKPRLVVENKADAKYRIVGAASIVAKVQRDGSIAGLREIYRNLGDLGSGYPSDPRTQQFIQNNTGLIRKKKLPFVRMEWDNIKKILHQRKQTRLSFNP